MNSRGDDNTSGDDHAPTDTLSHQRADPRPSILPVQHHHFAPPYWTKAENYTHHISHLKTPTRTCMYPQRPSAYSADKVMLREALVEPRERDRHAEMEIQRSRVIKAQRKEGKRDRERESKVVRKIERRPMLE